MCEEEQTMFDYQSDVFHPMDGTHFLTYGHYGSTVHDPMDGSYLNIIICNKCLKDHKEKFTYNNTYTDAHTERETMSIENETKFVIRVLNKRLADNISSNDFDKIPDVIEEMREQMVLFKLHQNLKDNK